MRLAFEGDGFLPDAGLSIVSEIITPGDIQVTGDGTPFVLLCESQTTGGYPRIGTVLPSDLPRAVQCPAGKLLRFAFVSLNEARQIEARARKDVAGLKPEPLVRDPKDMKDLLSYNLISGATAGS
jgi:allophanate hydrolase